MSKKEDTKKDEGIALSDLQVGDPKVLRPAELPLVIIPPEGKDWLNEEQARYAKVLNAAAYSNKQWSVPQKDPNGQDIPNSSIKDVELKRLVEIGTNPEKYYVYTGESRNPEAPSFTINNKLLDTNSK